MKKDARISSGHQRTNLGTTQEDNQEKKTSGNFSILRWIRFHTFWIFPFVTVSREINVSYRLWDLIDLIFLGRYLCYLDQHLISSSIIQFELGLHYQSETCRYDLTINKVIETWKYEENSVSNSKERFWRTQGYKVTSESASPLFHHLSQDKETDLWCI